VVRVADKKDVCGISKIWALPEDHPFTDVCIAHDKAFVKKKITGEGSFVKENVRFYKGMAAIARKEKGWTRVWRTIEAVVMYNVANIFGYYFWVKK